MSHVPTSQSADSDVYAVHVVRAHEIAATQLVCRGLGAAEEHARVLSADPGVLGSAVTRFVLDEAGRRTAVALYVAGERQAVPYVSDDRQVYANGRGGSLRLVTADE